jgi:hypothetical protein
MDHENAEQIGLSRTWDAGGIGAARERREPLFTGSRQ